uniref:cyclin-A1-like n=1 Tax=Agelaius phoeniceus TaxID=39638 RepID=UPI0023ED3845|nr:cyclin-A1-like [Agelaius phoeniceus]
MHRTGEKSRAARRESCPAALCSSGGWAVLGVLTDNGQQQQRPGGQGAAVIKRFSGFENTITSCRKDEVPNCIISAASKQAFAVYIDDSEDKENYSCQVSEELELSHCELDKLWTETLYLAGNFLERFLSCMSALRGKLQLVATAAILLAAKYEEIYPPDVDGFVYITDDTYTKKQLLRTEHLLLRVLGFDLTAPTVSQFLLQYIQRHGICMRTENFARYLAELSLLQVDPPLEYLPSQIAAAAYCLANYTVNRSFWPEEHLNIVTLGHPST